MKVSAGTMALCFLAAMFMGAGVSLLIHFNKPDKNHGLQLAIGIALVVVFIAIIGVFAHYQHSLKMAKHNLDEAQQLARLGSWERNLLTGKGYWSDNRYRLFGMKPAKTAPELEEYYNLIHADDREQVRQTVAVAVRDGSTYETSYRLARDPLKRVFLSRGKVVRNEAGVPVSIVGTTQDITEKLQQERFREDLLKQKNMLITRLGHDLKTPLTPLVALLPMINSLAVDEKQRQLIDTCVVNANHLRGLVSKIIQLARLSTPDQPQLNLEDVRLASCVDDCIHAMAISILGHGTSIENLIPEDIVVRADPQELEVVFQNLIRNAVSYSPPGSIVSIKATSAHGCATISIRDNGVGLSEEQQLHIFDDFYKADQSRHELESSGLGLAICSRIIEYHGGRIWAESNGLNCGTTIYFTLDAGGAA
jgi:signal transduction histidine kinase